MSVRCGLKIANRPSSTTVPWRTLPVNYCQYVDASREHYQRRLFYPGNWKLETGNWKLETGNWKHTVWDIPDFHEPINRGRLVPFP